MTDATPLRMLVGSYTEPAPHASGDGDGIVELEFDGERFAEPRVLARCRNPSWLALNAVGDRVYAVIEAFRHEGRSGGGIIAFSRSPVTGALDLLSTKPSGGAEPAFLALDATGRFLVVANCGPGSVAVHAIADDGSIGRMTDRAIQPGRSVDLERQTGPHAHMCPVDPTTKLIVVPDLGLDRILVYSLDGRGALVLVASVEAVPGGGPRHVAFHPNGELLVAVDELDSSLLLFARQGDGFRLVDVAPTRPREVSGINRPSGVAFGPGGRFVFVANRGDDSIGIVGLDPESGTLRFIGAFPCGGAIPRALIAADGGELVIVANQEGRSVVAFDFDENRIRLAEIARADVRSPACIALVPPSAY
jgi:6-phosphogluconolactonase